MDNFTPKKIPLEESLGEKLRQARRIKNMRLEEAANRTGIRFEYLAALEEERFDQLPTGLYGKNFLKEYATFLGLDANKILMTLEQRLSRIPKEDPFTQKIVKRNKFIIFPRIVRNAAIILAVAICLTYLTIYFKKITTPPELLVEEPASNLITSSSSLLIRGQTEKEAEVFVNGEAVLSNNDGVFYQTVNLKKGQNSLTISAKKKYSRQNTITRQILVE